MTVSNPFRADGEWLKCQFHAHSLCSDPGIRRKFIRPYCPIITTSHTLTGNAQSTSSDCGT